MFEPFEMAKKWDAETIRTHVDAIRAFQQSPAGQFLGETLNGLVRLAQDDVNNFTVIQPTDYVQDAVNKTMFKTLNVVASDGFGCMDHWMQMVNEALEREELERQK